MAKIIMDTHIHSLASDGLWTPTQVVEQAKSRGLEVIALTDHNTTFGVPEAIEAGKKNGVRVIPGIEIDAEYSKGDITIKDIELLGLGINLEKIRPFAEYLACVRNESFNAYIDAFNRYINSPDFPGRNRGMRFPLQNPSNLDLARIVAWKSSRNAYPNPSPFFSKVDLVFFLLDNFVVPSSDVELAKTGRKVYTEPFKEEYDFLFSEKHKKPSFYQAIEAVKKANGLSIVAHPGNSKGYRGGMVKEWEQDPKEWFSVTKPGFTPYHFFSDLVAHGLDGVELYYYAGNDIKHGEIQDKINTYFCELAKKLGIMVTYGSDCHGPKSGGPQMGRFGSERIYL